MPVNLSSGVKKSTFTIKNRIFASDFSSVKWEVGFMAFVGRIYYNILKCKEDRTWQLFDLVLFYLGNSLNY